MNQSNLNANQFITENKRVLFFFILFLLSSIGMFGQNKSIVNENVTIENQSSFNEVVPSSSLVSIESQIDFVGWFMGSKQPQIQSGFESETSTSGTITKKQILSSGITPNKVLYRTLMKEVSSQDNSIV